MFDRAARRSYPAGFPRTRARRWWFPARFWREHGQWSDALWSGAARLAAARLNWERAPLTEKARQDAFADHSARRKLRRHNLSFLTFV